MEKVIEGYNNYRITEYGQVISYARGYRHVLKQQLSPKGYLMVKLGRNKTIAVHRLVAMYYVDNPYNKTDVNHINEKKEYNYYKNLEWVTKKENNNFGNHNLNASNSNKKKIISLSDSGLCRIFNSVSDASNILDIRLSRLSECLNGKRVSYKGYKFFIV